MCEHIPAQLQRLPSDASHLVMSVGGNDAIMNAGILQAKAESTSRVIATLAEVSRGFEEAYRHAVTACMRLHLPLTVCTIYNGCFPDPDDQRLISTVLMT